MPAELSGTKLLQQGSIAGDAGVLHELPARQDADEEVDRRRRDTEVMADMRLNGKNGPIALGIRKRRPIAIADFQVKGRTARRIKSEAKP